MKLIQDAVWRHRKDILAAERYIWAHPETGYREEKTSAYLADAFRALGYELTMAEGITGFYTVVDTGREGPEVLVLAELDSVICPNHPESDPVTGAVHACGHNAQCAALLGVAAALRDPAVLAPLSGRIRLCCVPAEELLEIEYRMELMKAGRIKYFGGKLEFLSRGYFDGVDMAFMVHAAQGYRIRRGSNGLLAKSVVYKGVASHAGGAPHLGKNALYAAMQGINAINALRETFPDADHIRVHPIITHGGDIVNAIPAAVRLESYVRGATLEAIVRENAKVNRALVGAALSLGANVDIVDAPGYSPLYNAPALMTLARDAAALALPEVDCVWDPEGFSGGSTDMGDLSSVMPVVHPYAGGVTGTDHGADYYVTDPDAACVQNAVWQVTMLRLLLENGAKRAKDILAEFTPLFPTKEAFLSYLDSLNTAGNRIEYLDDGTVRIKL